MTSPLLARVGVAARLTPRSLSRTVSSLVIVHVAACPAAKVIEAPEWVPLPVQTHPEAVYPGRLVSDSW